MLPSLLARFALAGMVVVCASALTGCTTQGASAPKEAVAAAPLNMQLRCEGDGNRVVIIRFDERRGGGDVVMNIGSDDDPPRISYRGSLEALVVRQGMLEAMASAPVKGGVDSLRFGRVLVDLPHHRVLQAVVADTGRVDAASLKCTTLENDFTEGRTLAATIAH